MTKTMDWNDHQSDEESCSCELSQPIAVAVAMMKLQSIQRDPKHEFLQERD